MSKTKSRLAMRRTVWGHASDLISNYNSDRVIRPELEAVYPKPLSQSATTRSAQEANDRFPPAPPRWQV